MGKFENTTQGQLVLVCPKCHGNLWDKEGDGFICAVCGEFSHTEDMRVISQHINICPNCGTPVFNQEPNPSKNVQ